MSFEQTSLWQRTLAHIPDDPWERQRTELREAYQQFRAMVKPLAAEVVLTLPMFTDHGIDHIDALWDMASTICGDRFPLNPAEAFVLGGAFLMHDLGMALCALPDGLERIEADPTFAGLQSLATERMQSLEPSADPATVASVAHQQAIAEVLRLRHAEQAEHLLSNPMPDGNHLLSDAGLRYDYASTIGKIAESHWWDVSRLPEFGRTLGTRPGYDAGWSVDELKIACILRLADAAHIDNRRAPSYVHAFRRPTGVSADHWTFQERLMRPVADDDRLVYTSTRRFGAAEAPAWWLAYETIQMIDAELRRVDALCADLKRPRFRVRSVAGADAPTRLAAYVETDRWRPIDARIRVTDVDKVVSNLGGEKLYGKRPDVALRELIANASDATLARAARDDDAPGTVTITLTDEDPTWWLTVSDHGIGMRPDTMVSALTNFGFSRWRSPEMLNEYPELSNFRPTGQFGIGFFSVFMIADEVAVRSLALDEAARDTHVLEFKKGMSVRPLLRRAEAHERMRHPGTVIVARLRDDPRSVNGLFRTGNSRWTHTEYLHTMLQRMCALARVNINAKGPEDTAPVSLISADDWLSISDEELFGRVYRRSREYYGSRLALDAYEKRFLERAEAVYDGGGRLVGRAMMSSAWEGGGESDWPLNCVSHVYVGGLQASVLQDSMGVFAGSPLTANRLSAFPDAGPARFTAWAESQAQRLKNDTVADRNTRNILRDVARGFGAEAEGLPCAWSGDSDLDARELRQWLSARDRVFLVSDGEAFWVHSRADGRMLYFSHGGEELLFEDDCLVVSLYPPWNFPEEILPRPRDERFADAKDSGDQWNPKSWWYQWGNFGSIGLVVRAIADVWGMELAEVLDRMDSLALDDQGDRRRLVTIASGGVQRMEMILVRREV